jgi:hypothetical protein
MYNHHVFTEITSSSSVLICNQYVIPVFTPRFGTGLDRAAKLCIFFWLRIIGNRQTAKISQKDEAEVAGINRTGKLPNNSGTPAPDSRYSRTGFVLLQSSMELTAE